MFCQAISYTIGFVSRKSLFRLNFFHMSFRLEDPVDKVDFFDWICQSKNSVEKVLHLFFEPIASLIPPRNTPKRPHTHTRYHKAVSYNSADTGLAITVASRRKSAWHTPSSARQQRVSHDGSSALYRCHFANNGYACSSFGGSRLNATPRQRSFSGFRLSPTPPTSLDEGSRAKHALLVKNARSTELPTDFRLPYSCTPSHQPSLGK